MLTMLTFLGKATASLSDPSLCAEHITEVIWRRTFLRLSLALDLPKLGSKQPVLMLYMMERQSTKGTH